MSLLENIQPAVKKETKRVIVITLLGLFLMWILFAALHFIMPDKVPLDYTVFLGGIAGGCVALVILIVSLIVVLIRRRR